MVANVYRQLISSPGTTGIDQNKHWMELSHDFEEKVDALIFGCLNSIEHYITQDVQDTAYQGDGTNSQAAADQLKTKLDQRYNWVKWLVIVSKQKDEHSTAEARFPNGQGFQYLPEGDGTNRHIVAVPLLKEPSTPECQYQFPGRGISTMDAFKEMCDFTMTSAVGQHPPEPCVREQFDNLAEYIEGQLLAVSLHHYTDLVYAATNADEGPAFAIDQDAQVMLQRRQVTTTWMHYILGPMPEQLDVSVIVRSPCQGTMNTKVCNRATCNNRGQCERYPFTNDFICSCDLGYEGDMCETFSR